MRLHGQGDSAADAVLAHVAAILGGGMRAPRPEVLAEVVGRAMGAARAAR